MEVLEDLSPVDSAHCRDRAVEVERLRIEIGREIASHRASGRAGHDMSQGRHRDVLCRVELG